MSVWLGLAVLFMTLAVVWGGRSASFLSDVQAIAAAREAGTESGEKADATEALKKDAVKKLPGGKLGKPGTWTQNPLDSFSVESKSAAPSPEPSQAKRKSLLPGIGAAFLVCWLLFTVGTFAMGESPVRFTAAFLVVFALATFSYVLAGQKTVNHYNLEFALWALVGGMLISNTIGTPAFLRPAIRTEFYIKTGLVLFGAEILLPKLVALGLPGIFISWVVTPIVFVGTYLFGQYVLRVPSKSLNLVVSADMSVCGVSAAIATAAACRAKKEELSLAIGLSLSFTVLMMIVMPTFILKVGMDPILGGAWIGGTIDSTGAVVAAGEFLGKKALVVAFTVKMIQNILIGVIAFGVAVYWVSYVERRASGARPNPMEIWYRFPRFILGFIGASILFSLIHSSGVEGELLVRGVFEGTTANLRGWLFCLAFVSIGLETNFLELGEHMKGGKALILYVCGQTLNLILTLAMAWLMFTKVYPEAASALSK